MSKRLFPNANLTEAQLRTLQIRRERAKAWNRNNAARSKANRVSYAARLKSEIVQAYGGKCVCCGESNPGFLTIDHIFNDGQEDRAKNGSGQTFYTYLRNSGFPKDRYRLMCMNCNWARRNGVCPHEVDRKVSQPRQRASHAAKSGVNYIVNSINVIPKLNKRRIIIKFYPITAIDCEFHLT